MINGKFVQQFIAVTLKGVYLGSRNEILTRIGNPPTNKPLNFMKLTVTMLICLKICDINTPLLITLGFTENFLTSKWLITKNLLKLISDYFLI